MEMNTRLQVEHPVSEAITGQDLVEWQLRVACGEPLPLTQEQIQIHGHALEARIYAEDPAKGFLPSTGKLLHLAPPEENLHVRVDTGVEEDDEIGPFYDPMIAKLIVWGMNREQALARMLRALAQYRIVGVANNVDFLARLVASPAFAQADLDTDLIEREREFLFATESPIPREILLVAALATLLREEANASRRSRPATVPIHYHPGTDAMAGGSIPAPNADCCSAPTSRRKPWACAMPSRATRWNSTARRRWFGANSGQTTGRWAQLGGRWRLNATVMWSPGRNNWHVFLHGRG